MKKLNLKQQKKGFTLIELIVLLSVLASLALISVPSYAGIMKKSHETVTKSNCKTAVIASEALLALDINKNSNENTFTNDEILQVKQNSKVPGTINLVTYNNNNITYLEYTNLQEKITAIYDVTKDPKIFIKNNTNSDKNEDTSIISDYESILNKLSSENETNINDSIPSWLKDVNFNDLPEAYKTKALQQEILNKNNNEYETPSKTTLELFKQLLLNGVSENAIPKNISKEEFINHLEDYIYCKPVISSDAQNIINIFTTDITTLGSTSGLFIQYKDNCFYHTNTEKTELNNDKISDTGDISKELDKMIADPNYTYNTSGNGIWNINK